MKIINQSITLQKAPYFHLAYLAASSRMPAANLLKGGLFIIFLGCIISLKLTTLKSAKEKSKIKSAIVLRKDKPKWLALGLIFVTAGFVLIALSYKYGNITYNYPEHFTKSRIRTLNHYIEMHTELGEPIPETISSMSKQWQLKSSDVRDAWSNLLMLKTEIENGTTQYIITSAGKDGDFGTIDDIVGRSQLKNVSSEQTVNKAGINR